jgi:hypothetical protein
MDRSWRKEWKIRLEVYPDCDEDDDDDDDETVLQ